jgi:hypothetical protein
MIEKVEGFIEMIKKYYPMLIAGNAARVLREFKENKLTAIEKCLMALALGLTNRIKKADVLLKQVTQTDVDTFNDREKSLYFEAEAVAHSTNPRQRESVMTLCRNALLRFDGAYFARLQLAKTEAIAHPQKGVEQLEILLKYYPGDEETLFTSARLLMKMKKIPESRAAVMQTHDRLRRNLYRIIIELLSNWVFYTLAFILLILVIYTPIISIIFFILASLVCVGFMVYGFIKKDPFIFNFFFSYNLVIIILIVVKWLLLK